ncbi:ribonucleotide reductase [Earliella scabrosa]|nr:ribonucleotide reductase [Earliella scabrosa]
MALINVSSADRQLIEFIMYRTHHFVRKEEFTDHLIKMSDGLPTASRNINLVVETVFRLIPHLSGPQQFGPMSAAAIAELGTYDHEYYMLASRVLAHHLHDVTPPSFAMWVEVICSMGLADTFIAFGVSYGSNESRALNIDIFQTLYHGALEMSTELAERSGPYADWRRSPAYRGVLHVDQWPLQGTHSYDFDNLRTRIILHGLRNAVITTQCPQSGPLHAFPYAPGAGPQLTNVLCREVINRSYVEVRRSLVDALREIGMWNAAVRSSIMMTDGSIQHIDGIPSEIMELYRTARDISPNVYLEMASDRAAYIDQSEVMPVDICTEDETILLIEMKVTLRRGKLPQPMCLRRDNVTSPALRSAVARIHIQGEYVAMSATRFAAVAEDPSANSLRKIMNAALFPSADGDWPRVTMELEKTLAPNGRRSAQST